MKTAKSFLVRVSCLAVICLLGAVNANAQNTESRLLKKASVSPVEPAPLEITNLKVNGASIDFNQPFQADDEWLKNLTFDVKNVSGKAITHFQIGVLLHNPDNNQRAVAKMVWHGRDTGLPNVQPTVRVANGEVIHATYDERRYEGLKGIRERISLSKITSAELSLDMVVFEDDTSWRLGNLYRRDPANPMQWNVIATEQATAKPKPEHNY